MIEIDNERQKEKNTIEISNDFYEHLDHIKYKGAFGVANFSLVFENLIPPQQSKLKLILGDQLENYMNTGSLLSLGIAYHPEIIDKINVKEEGKINKTLWDIYSKEYRNINELLKEIGKKIAEKHKGIMISPTTETPAEQITDVRDYFPKTISHRIVAEMAGMGWRGKNELLINEKFGPTLRFVSVLINKPLIQGKKMESKCGSCRACLDACSILNIKDKLNDYREYCRRYIESLGLRYDVCGKCIKACFKNSIYKDTFI